MTIVIYCQVCGYDVGSTPRPKDVEKLIELHIRDYPDHAKKLLTKEEASK